MSISTRKIPKPDARPTTPWPARLGNLVDPKSRAPLRFDTPRTLTDGGRRWPVVDGIPFLREGREPIRLGAVARLDRGDDRGALSLLLADRDDFAPGPPPDPSSLLDLINSVDEGMTTLRGAMQVLGYGPVSDYFAHRPAMPTFLSGLGLLASHPPGPGEPVVEVACGIGSFLRAFRQHGQPAAGIDVVFSKLWLARRFVCPGVPLVCADVVRGWPIEPASEAEGGPVAVFCHDALYFLPEKGLVLDRFRRLAGDGGRVLIGHAHNRRFDHRGIAGSPLSPDEYRRLLPGALLYDDAELARVPLGEPAGPKGAGDLSGVEAVAMAWGSGRGGDSPDRTAPDLALPAAGVPLRINPLLRFEGDRIAIDWPTDRMRAEYESSSDYLVAGAAPSFSAIEAARLGTGRSPEVDDLARRRVLVDLPERW